MKFKQSRTRKMIAVEQQRTLDRLKSPDHDGLIKIYRDILNREAKPVTNDGVI